MSSKLEAYGYIKEGRLKILNRKRLEADLAAFPDVDVQVIIKKRGKRSSQQNAYYWSTVVVEIRNELKRMGNRVDSETVHAWLKEKFNPEYIRNEDGEVIDTIGGSTTILNKQEFTEYIERICEWCAKNLKIVIPAPGEQVELFKVA